MFLHEVHCFSNVSTLLVSLDLSAIKLISDTRLQHYSTFSRWEGKIVHLHTITTNKVQGM